MTIASKFRSNVLGRVCTALIITAIAAGAAAQPASSEPRPASQPASSEAAAGAAREAETLKVRGDELFRARSYLDAVAAYDKSYAIHPDARVLYNKARALQALGQFGPALDTLRRFEQEAPAALKANIPGLSGLLSELRNRVAELTIVTNVPGAQILWDDRVLGVTGENRPLLLNAGRGKLQVVKDGYFPFVRELELRGGGAVTVDVQLESKLRHGKLLVQSSIPGTQITVDRRRLGNAPTETVLLPGTHEVVAERSGYESASTRVVIEAGQHRTIALNPIAKEGPFYTRWWFLTGVGVVAAGTVTTFVLLNRTRDESSGDFTPDTVRAPLARF